MCIAIYNHNDMLSRQTIKNCWDSNDDGAGMLWVENGVLMTHKQLKDLDSFYAKYQDIRSKTDTVVMHFRIRTHGEVDINNIHPFLVDDNVGLVHNGIISQHSVANSKYSDTYHFTEFLRTMPKGFQNSEACLALIEDYIGKYNKLIFLDSDGNAEIVNEAAGIWDGNSWFSNESYLDPTARYYGHIRATSKDYKWESINVKDGDFYDDGFYKYPLSDNGLIDFDKVDWEQIDTENWDEAMWDEYYEWESQWYEEQKECKECGVKLYEGLDNFKKQTCVMCDYEPAK